MADPPRQRASSYLVVIPYDDIDGLQRLRPLNLHLLDLQADQLAAIVLPEELATLRSLGFDVRVLDAPAAPELYYLVTPSPTGETAALYRYGQVFPYVEGAFLFKADPVQAESLSIQGFSIQKLLGPIVLPAMPSPSEVDATSIVIQEHDPLIQNLVDSVSQTQIYTSILELQDDDALPGWDAERSRYTYVPELAIERDYVRDRMEALGLDVRYHNFNFSGDCGVPGTPCQALRVKSTPSSTRCAPTGASTRARTRSTAATARRSAPRARSARAVRVSA